MRIEIQLASPSLRESRSWPFVDHRNDSREVTASRDVQ